VTQVTLTSILGLLKLSVSEDKHRSTDTRLCNPKPVIKTQPPRPLLAVPKCISPPINGQCTNHRIVVLWSVALRLQCVLKGLNSATTRTRNFTVYSQFVYAYVYAVCSGVFRISVRRGRRARRRRRELGVVEGAGPLPPQNNFCPQSDKFGCILP